MAYKDTLSEIINKSGLSLREIANRCKTLGIPISNSYISQLQTGKLPPPSEDVSRAIAKTCNVSPDRLIIEGYLEKAPDIIKYYLSLSYQTNKSLYMILKEIVTLSLSKDSENNSDTIEKIKIFENSLDELGQLDLMHDSIEYLKRFNIKSKFKMPNFTRLINDKFINNKDYNYFKDEFIFMEDDSMEPIIPKDSILEFSPYREINPKTGAYVRKEPQNKDIILFVLAAGDEKKLVRRFFKHDNILSLIPENKKYDIMYLNRIEDIFPIGKITSYKASIE